MSIFGYLKCRLKLLLQLVCEAGRFTRIRSHLNKSEQNSILNIGNGYYLMNSPLSARQIARRRLRYSRTFSPVLSPSLRRRIEANSINESPLSGSTNSTPQILQNLYIGSTPGVSHSRMSADAPVPPAVASDDNGVALAGDNSTHDRQQISNDGQQRIVRGPSLETYNRIMGNITRSMDRTAHIHEMLSKLSPDDPRYAYWQEQFRNLTGTNVSIQGLPANNVPSVGTSVQGRNSNVESERNVNYGQGFPANANYPALVPPQTGHWAAMPPNQITQRLITEYKEYKRANRLQFLRERANVLQHMGASVGEVVSESEDEEGVQDDEHSPCNNGQREAQRNINSDQRRQSRDSILNKVRQVNEPASNFVHTNMSSNPFSVHHDSGNFSSDLQPGEIQFLNENRRVDYSASSGNQANQHFRQTNRTSFLNIANANNTYVPPPMHLKISNRGRGSVL